MKIEAGDSAIVILHSPREKTFGVVEEINAAGVYVRGVDLNYFEEWILAIKNDETYLPPQDYFYPMWRVERIVRDEEGFGSPSLAERFHRQTGFELKNF